MKKITVFLAAAGFLSLLHLNGYSQVVVTVRPHEPEVVVAAPAAPSPRHVWQKPHWVWNARVKRYDWVEGVWVLPPSEGQVWVEGSWRERHGGWVWVPGHWAHHRR